MADGKHKIMVIEDERPLLEIIQKKLESSGFEVVTGRSAEQALDYLNGDVAVDAIWLDHYLLGQDDGLKLFADLKDSEGEWRNIPVFVVSNTAGAETVQRYLRFGVEKYFTKADYKLDDIVTDIQTYLEHGELQEQNA